MPNCAPQGALIPVRTGETLKATHWARAWCSAGYRQMLVPVPFNFPLSTYHADVGASKLACIQLQMVRGFYESETPFGLAREHLSHSRSISFFAPKIASMLGVQRKTTWSSVAFVVLSHWSAQVGVELSLVPICNPSQARWLHYFCDPLGLTGL